MSGSLCFWNLCVRKFCRAYIDTDHILVKGQGVTMEMLVMMSGKTYATTVMAAAAVGAAGAAAIAWLCNKWEQSYNEARNAGVVK
jgi:hypothetical protein